VKTFLQIFFLLSLSTLAVASVMDYVHTGQDFYILVNNLKGGLDRLSKVSELYSYVVSDSGLAMGRVVQNFAETVAYEQGVDPSVIENALTKPFLLTGKGANLSLDALISVDPYYFVDLLKHLGEGFAVIFDVDTTKEASTLLRNIAKLLKAQIKSFPTSYQLRTEDSLLYSWMDDDVLVFAGSEPAVFDAVEAGNDPKYRLLNSSKIASETYKELADAWILGYFSKESLTLDLGVQFSVETKYVTLSASVTNSGLVADISQSITFLATDVAQKLLGANVELGELESQKMMGNYLVTLSPEVGAFALNEFKKWVVAQGEATESSIYQLVEDLLESAKAISLSGDLTVSTPTFSLILRAKDGFGEAWSRLAAWGVEPEEKDGWKEGKLESNGTLLYFLESPRGLFVITSIEPHDFMASFSSFPTLGVAPGYSIIKDELLSDCVFLTFVDVSSALSSSFGKLPTSAFIVQQRLKSDETIRYRLIFR